MEKKINVEVRTEAELSKLQELGDKLTASMRSRRYQALTPRKKPTTK